MKSLERFWQGCGGHCHDGSGTCPIAERFENADQDEVPFGSGFSLVAASAGVFLLPLGLGILCGHAAGHWLAGDADASRGFWQITGLISGAVLGALIVKVAVAIAQRKTRVAGGSQNDSRR